MNKPKETTQFDAKQEGLSSSESAQADFGDQAASSFASEPIPPAYQNDPSFQGILLNFQNAEWDECLNKIDQFIVTHPEDKFLSAFREDVEERRKRQLNSQQQQVKERREKFLSVGLRVLVIIAVGLIVFGLVLWAGNVYQEAQREIALEHEATLTAQVLDSKYQNAESFLRAGKPEEAFRLYNEIQQIDPAYKDIEQKVQQAQEAIAIEALYQQGLQAIKDGKSDEALETLSRLDGLHPKYKNTPQLIQQIQQEQQIASLVKEIHAAFAKEDWEGVIRAHESIRAISSSIQIPEVNEELFISYRNLIVGIAERGDATLEEIELAEKYYHNALAIFPQNREYAEERDELRKIADVLLANKYYLYGINLLQSTDYSARNLPEAIRILKKASNIGSNSPVVNAEIEKAQLFLDSYNNLLNNSLDSAITGLEKLRNEDENYAAGRVKYLLYEAYTARGDLLLTYADFAGALDEYQKAEIIAWGNEGSVLRLFQIQVRIANALNKLERTDEAAEYYHFAFDRLGYQTRLANPDKKELLDILVQAEQAYKEGKSWEAVHFYQAVMEKEKDLYYYVSAAVRQGDTLADVAYEYNCTFEILRLANRIGETMVFASDQEILVPK